MSDLSADEEAALIRELGAAAAMLTRTATGLAATPPAGIDVQALRDVLGRVPVIVTRLRARGTPSGRAKAVKAQETVEAIMGRQLPATLIRVLLARTPVPGGGAPPGGDPTAIDLAEAYHTVTEWLMRRDPRNPIISDLKRGFLPFLERTRAYVEATERAMEGPDHPDLAEIAANVLRLDVLTWVLVIAGFPKEAGEVQTRTRRVARSTLKRATVIMTRCAATFGLVDRINLAGTLAEVDDIVLIFQRVRDGEREEARPGDETFVQSLGEQVVSGFTRSVVDLGRSIMDCYIAGTIDLGDTARGTEIAGMLRALAKLRQLLVGVKDERTEAAVAQMTRDIGAGLVQIVDLLAQATERARAEQDVPRLKQIDTVRRAFAVLGEAMEGRP